MYPHKLVYDNPQVPNEEATFTVKWIENVDFDLNKEDEFKEVK